MKATQTDAKSTDKPEKESNRVALVSRVEEFIKDNPRSDYRDIAAACGVKTSTLAQAITRIYNQRGHKHIGCFQTQSGEWVYAMYEDMTVAERKAHLKKMRVYAKRDKATKAAKASRKVAA